MKEAAFCVVMALAAIFCFYVITITAGADTFVNGQRTSDAGTWLRVTDCNTPTNTPVLGPAFYVFQDKPYYVNSQWLATRLDQ